PLPLLASRDFGTKIGTRHTMGGRSTEAKFASSPPIFYKFQIFSKNFPALPLGKIASNFLNHKTMREFHSLKLP
ncbi:hypothetical protein CYQ53_13980, partial [Enterococcus faecalis]